MERTAPMERTASTERVFAHHDASTLLSPGIRTFKTRRSRITPTQERALISYAHYLIEMRREPLNAASDWQMPGAPIVVEIGFGTGTSTVAMAEHDRSTALLAIDVHTPGIGDLLDKAGAAQLTNVRVMEADALTVLERMVLPESLSGVRSYFPDPWPKARHHKRRLVQPPIAQLLNSRLLPGGYWHIATDWEEYAESIESVMAEESGWIGGQIERPVDRPVTMFEARALREGRTITDLLYTKA